MTGPGYGEQFIDEYFAECDEHLATIRRTLLTLEERRGRGEGDPAVSPAELQALRRALHTVKGLSGMVGLACAELLSHAMEDALRHVTAQATRVGPELLEALFTGTRHLEACIAARRAGEGSDVAPSVLARLSAAARGASPTPGGQPAARGEGEADHADRDARPPSPHQRMYRFEFTPSDALSRRGVGVTTIRTRLQAIGEVLDVQPRVVDGSGVVFSFLVVLRPDDAPDERWRDDGLVWAIAPDALDRPAADERVAASARAKSRAAEVTARDANAAPDPMAFPATGFNMVRVDLGRVDALMRIVSDMVVTRARLQSAISELSDAETDGRWEPLRDANALIERQLRSLREGITRIRLVAIGEVFERLRFAVRDLARESGKEIVLDLSGGDTEIDKLVVDRMLEPLLHLVRNAVSHGIEAPEVRRTRGKPEAGRLALRASAIGDRICIEVEDDGAGVDIEQVAAAARARGLLGSADGLTPGEILDVLAEPGFSTRPEADLASGRGVGMAVVQGAVRELGGEISMRSTPGHGTHFTIELPLTLMIVDALLVEIGGERMAVPQPALREILPAEPATFTRFENNEVIPYRGGVLPIVTLRRLFALSAQPTGPRHVLVVGNEPRLAGLLVDRLLGLREIVVHPIPDPLVAVPGIAGATELGDGRVSLILDAPALVRLAQQAAPAPGGAGAPVPTIPLAENPA